jgi:hypothetical protein
MNKAPHPSRRSGLLLTGIIAVTSAFLAFTGTAGAQTLLVRVPFTDTGAGTTCVSDTSTGGAAVSLQMVNNAGAAADFHGTPGGGVSGLGVALDFSTNTDFTVGPGEGEIVGLGPMAAVTNSALNFGTIGAFTATVWFKANAQMSSVTDNTVGPRIFTLGTNGTTDKGVTNSLGLYWQTWNEVSVTFGTNQINSINTNNFGATNTTTFVPTNRWLFYAITYDGGNNLSIYSGSDTTPALLLTNTANSLGAGGSGTLPLAPQVMTFGPSPTTLQVGNRANGLSRPFDGWIDDFRFYSGTATANFVEDTRWSAVAPTNVIGSIVAGQATLTWDTLSVAASYNVSRAAIIGGPYTQIATGVTTTNYTDATAVLGAATYYYEISAVNANGDATTSANSTPVSVPPTPIAVLGTLEDGGVGLTWSDSDVASYDILRATSPGGPFTTIASDVTTTNYLDTTVTIGTQFYYYEVVGVNANGSTPASPASPVSYGQGNQLADPGFEASSAIGPWTFLGNQGNDPIQLIGPTDTYYNAGQCPKDPTAEVVTSHSGTNVAKIYGNYSAPVNDCYMRQEVAATPDGTWAAGGWTYASHEDLMVIPNEFFYEVDFLGASGNLLASYESFIVTNLTCDGPNSFPLDTWTFLAVTNVMQVTAGANTGVVTGNLGASGVMTAPVGTVTAEFSANFANVNYGGGSIYFDDCELDLINGALPPTISTITPNGIILCTNEFLNSTASSSTGTITNVQLLLTTTPFGTTTTNTVTTNLTSSSVSGLGTATAIVNYALTPNLIYHVTVTASDNNGFPVSGSVTFDTVAPSLVIEAEDFNYTNGGYMNTPANGGLALYTNKVGNQTVDENKGDPANGAQGYYRPDDLVVIQGAAPDNGTAQKYVTSEANGDSVDVPVEVGYNTPLDWVDYTRDFGSASSNSAPAGTYYLWGRLATDGDGNPGVEMYQVTGDPTQPNQTENLLGYLNFADSDWNGFDYVPLVDQFGNLVSVTLSGHETLRETMAGNVNCDFYMLVPATPILTPVLQYYNPTGIHPFQATNSFTFTVGAANGAGIDSTGIGLVINGVNVTPQLTFTGATNSWTTSYPILSNSIYTVVINITNTAGLTSSFTKNFDTFNPNNYIWEADDYDYTTNGVSGVFIDNPVPTCDTTAPDTGHEETNSYFAWPGGSANVGLAKATSGIDFFDAAPQPEANDFYRADGQGCQPASDYVRAKFVAAQTEFNDPNIGPFNIGWTTAGDWENYTRHYPTGNFYVYGRLAGGAGAWTGEQLDLLTSGYGTATQTTNILGIFSDPNPAGYQAWHWIPCLDTNGNMVVVPLGGQTTLQIVCGTPGINEEFYMLVPAPLLFKVTSSVSAGQLTLSFPTEIGFTYTVKYKSNLAATTWTPVGSTITGNGSVQAANEVSAAPGYYTIVASQ